MTPAEAIARSYSNRAEVERSERCGCYNCQAIFHPSDITLWSDSEDPADEDPGALRDDKALYRGYTAICPFCRNDSVIGSASGVPIDVSTLGELRAYLSKR